MHTSYNNHNRRQIMLISTIFQVTQVNQPLFTYDTVRRADPYTRLDSDASSLGPSLSPSAQVSSNFRIYFIEFIHEQHQQVLVMQLRKAGIFRGIFQ